MRASGKENSRRCRPDPWMFRRSIRLELLVAVRTTGLAVPLGLVFWQLCCWLQEPAFFRQLGLAIAWRGSSTAAILASLVYFTVGRKHVTSWLSAFAANIVLSAGVHSGSLLFLFTLDSITGQALGRQPALLLADSWLRCLPAAALAPGLCSRGWSSVASLGAVVASSALLLGLAPVPGPGEPPSLVRLLAVTMAILGSLLTTRTLAARQP